MGTGGISAQTLGTILTGLVHCLEPHGFHLGILVRDGAEEVVAAAVLADLARVPLDDDLVHQHLGQRASINSR
jgi:hypothetical protein